MIRHIITLVLILLALHFFGLFSLTKIGAPNCPFFGAGHCNWQVEIFHHTFTI